MVLYATYGNGFLLVCADGFIGIISQGIHIMKNKQKGWKGKQKILVEESKAI